MRLKRNVPLATGLSYRGRGNQLAFVLHRIGGLGMAIFVTMHLLASFFGGAVGRSLNGFYESWLFQIFIFFCVLFHAINGLRITIMDLWPKTLEHQNEALWLEWAVFVPLFGIAAFVIVRSALGG